MRIDIALWGRFHAFYLAEQLQKYKSLNQLITTYPISKVKEFDIEPERIKSLVHLEALSRLYQKLPSLIKGQRNLQLFWLEWFDREVTKILNSKLDIFVGWSGACFHSLHRAKELDSITVVERGSSHMAYQTQILKEEYELWGQKFVTTHPGVYEREIHSYHENDYISIPSLFVKQTFLDQGIPEEKIIHVPYGASIEQFYPTSKKDDEFRVIHCGGVNLRKGVQYLLQAFHELNLPNAELWLVGSINLQEIKPFLSKYESNKIILKGHQPQNQLKWFYSQCSVFCIASIEEGLAMVQCQAMACGLPVIHTTNTGGSDIVRDGVDGFCIPIRDVEAIKEKILFFYENPDKRAEMGQNALLQARNTLSWDDYGNKMITKYKQILAAKK